MNRNRQGASYLTAVSLIVILELLPTVICPVGAANYHAANHRAPAVSANVRLNFYGKKINLAGSPVYRKAIADFAAHKYSDALKGFQLLDKTGSCCDMVHYYIAQCYQCTDQITPAILHYQWVSNYSKDKTLIYYSSTAIAQLDYYNNNRTYVGYVDPNPASAIPRSAGPSFQAAANQSGTFSRC